MPSRLKAIPTDGAPLEGAVTVHWNDNQVPFIEAASDDDLAVTLGSGSRDAICATPARFEPAWTS